MPKQSAAGWLRSLMRRKSKYATGGLVSGPRPGDAPLVPIGQGGCAWPVDLEQARQRSGALHAHEISPDDAAVIRMLSGANFGPNASVTLLSGRTVTGDEMRRWVEDSGDDL